MRTQGLFVIVVLFAAVLFSYNSANAQIVEKVKDAADKTKDVTVETTKKTGVIVTDSLAEAADKTKNATVEGAKTAGSTTKSFGNHAVTVTEGVVGQAIQKGKWFTVTTWDGTKWVSKRTFFPDKNQ